MRLLVIEDEHRIAQALKEGLEQESYAVDVCHDGEDGYNTASADEYDLIILDVMLPGMDGIEVCRKLRAEGNHTLILMLTAKDQNHDIVHGLDAGADDYLPKPFSFEVLLARFFFIMVPDSLQYLDDTDRFLDVTLPAFYMTDALVLAAVTFLVLRRIQDAKMRVISLPTDFFPLFLIMAIVVAGISMRYVTKVDVMPVKTLMLNLLNFSFEPPGEIGTLFYVHLFLICVLAIYFPFSKLMHMGGIFLSPTRNQCNNSRAKRHSNPWNTAIKFRTYAEYEDDYRDKMKKAKLPVEKQ